MTQEIRPWARPLARLSQHIIDKLTERMRLLKKPKSVLWVGLTADQQIHKEVAKDPTRHVITVEQLEDNFGQQARNKSALQYGAGMAHLIGSDKRKVWNRLQALNRYLMPDSPVFISAITEIAWQKEGVDSRLLYGQEALANVAEIGRACSAVGFTGGVLERVTVHCAFPDSDTCVEDMMALITGLFDGDSQHAEVLKARLEQIGKQPSASQNHLVRVEVILGHMFSAKKSEEGKGGMIEVPVSEVKMRSPSPD